MSLLEEVDELLEPMFKELVTQTQFQTMIVVSSALLLIYSLLVFQSTSFQTTTFEVSVELAKQAEQFVLEVECSLLSSFYTFSTLPHYLKTHYLILPFYVSSLLPLVTHLLLQAHQPYLNP